MVGATLLVLAATTLSQGSPSDPRDAILKIYVTTIEPSYWAPWEPGTVSSSTGSGFIIEGGASSRRPT